MNALEVPARSESITQTPSMIEPARSSSPRTAMRAASALTRSPPEPLPARWKRVAAGDGGDRRDGLEHARRVGVQRPVAAAPRPGCATRARNLLDPHARATPAGCARAPVDEVVLVDSSRHEEHRLGAHHVGLRGVLDELNSSVRMKTEPGVAATSTRPRGVASTLEGSRGEDAMSLAKARAPRTRLAPRSCKSSAARRVGQQVVARRLRRRVGSPARSARGARPDVEPGVLEESSSVAPGGEVALDESGEHRVVRPAGSAKRRSPRAVPSPLPAAARAEATGEAGSAAGDAVGRRATRAANETQARPGIKRPSGHQLSRADLSRSGRLGGEHRRSSSARPRTPMATAG